MATNPNSLPSSSPTSLPSPDLNRKPLLSADTLYDTTVYSAEALNAPFPYIQRIENDRSNPINIPTILENSSLAMITTPTDNALLHKYHIICPNVESMNLLKQSISSQFNQQLSPLYLLYRSNEHVPRIVTKDQIPNAMDQNPIIHPHFIPKPLVSLNIPTVSNIIQNPLPSIPETLLYGAGLGAGLYGLSKIHQTLSWSGIGEFNTHQLQLSENGSLLGKLSSIGQHRILRNTFGSTLLQGTALWSLYFGLRHFHLSQIPFQKAESTAGGGFTPMYALEGTIQAQNSNNIETFPYAISLKTPDIFSTPLERTTAALKTTAIIAPLSYLIGSKAYHTYTTEKIISSIGKVPSLIQNVEATIPRQFIAKQSDLIPIDSKQQQPRQVPTHGVINRQVYEAFFYDHTSPHLYSQYEQGKLRPTQSTLTSSLSIDKLKSIDFKYWFKTLFPSSTQLHEYNESMARFIGTTNNNPTNPSNPLWLVSSSSRIKFHSIGFLCAAALWTHLNTSIFAYEYLKQNELTQSDSLPFFARLFTNNNNDDISIDPLLKNEINHVNNTSIPSFLQAYYIFKSSGMHQKLWDDNKIVQANEMMTAKAKLQTLRDQSVSNLTLDSIISTMNKDENTSSPPPDHKNDIKQSKTLAFATKSAAFQATLFAAATSLLFLPLVHHQHRRLIGEVLQTKIKKIGLIGYIGSSTGLSAAVLGTMAHVDTIAFTEQRQQLDRLSQTGLFVNAVDSTTNNINSLSNLPQASNNITTKYQHYFENNLVLPSQNHGFFEAITDEQAASSSIWNSIPKAGENYPLYAPQMFGWKPIKQKNGTFLLKRGQYILPYKHITRLCPECGSASPETGECLCNAVNFNAIIPELDEINHNNNNNNNQTTQPQISSSSSLSSLPSSPSSSTQSQQLKIPQQSTQPLPEINILPSQSQPQHSIGDDFGDDSNDDHDFFRLASNRSAV